MAVLASWIMMTVMKSMARVAVLVRRSCEDLADGRNRKPTANEPMEAKPGDLLS